MTIIEIIDSARNLLSEPLDSTRTFPDDTTSYWTDTEMLGFFNMVQQEVQQVIVSVFEDYFVTQTSINIVGSSTAYALPTDFLKMRRVEDARFPEPVEIRPLTIQDKETFPNPYITQGQSYPDGYYLMGNQFVLTDPPNYTQQSAITFYYVKRLADFTTSQSTQTSEIPGEFHMTLVWGIVKYCLFKQQTPNDYATKEYDRGLNNIVKFAESRQIQRPRKVKRSRNFY